MKPKESSSEKKLSDIIKGILPFDVVDGNTPMDRLAAFSVAQELRNLGCNVNFEPERMIIQKGEEKIIFGLSV